MSRVSIVGCRNYKDYEKFSSFLDDFFELETDGAFLPEVIVTGGAKGIDSMSEKWAKSKNIKVEVYEADWKKYGLKAGPKRNTLIVENSDVMLPSGTFQVAFPSSTSRGTLDSIKKMKKSGKLCLTFNLPFE